MTKCKKALLFVFAVLMVLGINQAYADYDHDNQYVRYIDFIGHNGIEINKPGVYRFKKNIEVYFREDDVAAIVINSDNVVLDLNQYRLTQDADTANNIGILIAPDVWSVTIKNGTVEEFSGFGIVAAPWTGNLQFKDLLITGNGWDGEFELPDDLDHSGGILLDGSYDPIWDVRVENCRILWNYNGDDDVAFSGLAAVGVIKFVMKNTDICDNWVESDYSCVGAEFMRSSDVTIDGCHFDDNWIEADDDNYSHVYGVLFNETEDSDDDSNENQNIKITNCTANRMGGDPTEVGGFGFYKSRNIFVENCESYGNFNYLNDEDDDFDDTAVSGFQFYICDHFNVNNCRAYDHRTDDPSNRMIGGFDIVASNYGVISNCHAAYCNNDGGAGICAGFLVEPFTGRDGYDRSIGIVFENCISERNEGGTGDAYPSGGFVLAKAEEAKIINCEAIHNAPFGIVVGLQNGEGSDDTISSIIKDNIAFSNLFAGIIDITGNEGNGVVGEGNTSNALANAYLGNVARTNGDNPEVDNYDLPLGNSIVDWNLSGGFSSGANEETDNISIY